MPKPYGMTNKGKLHWFLKQNADRHFSIKDLRVRFPNFKSHARALEELVANGYITVQGQRGGRWYQYKKPDAEVSNGEAA
jgi:hypothetical protein